MEGFNGSLNGIMSNLSLVGPLSGGAPRWRSPMWSAQAQAERLTLRVADNKAGYFGVSLNKPGQTKPYLAHLKRGGKDVNLGYFATAEEAALCVARSPEGQAAAQWAAAAPPLTSEEARQQAQADRPARLAAGRFVPPQTCNLYF